MNWALFCVGHVQQIMIHIYSMILPHEQMRRHTFDTCKINKAIKYDWITSLWPTDMQNRYAEHKLCIKVEWVDWPHHTKRIRVDRVCSCPNRLQPLLNIDEFSLSLSRSLSIAWRAPLLPKCHNNSIGGNAIWLEVIRRGENKKIFSPNVKWCRRPSHQYWLWYCWLAKKIARKKKTWGKRTSVKDCNSTDGEEGKKNRKENRNVRYTDLAPWCAEQWMT